MQKRSASLQYSSPFLVCQSNPLATKHNWAPEINLSILWQPSSWSSDMQGFNTFIVLMKSCKCNEHAQGNKMLMSSNRTAERHLHTPYIWLSSDPDHRVKWRWWCMQMAKLSSVPLKAGQTCSAWCAQLFPDLRTRWCEFACSVLSESVSCKDTMW